MLSWRRRVAYALQDQRRLFERRAGRYAGALQDERCALAKKRLRRVLISKPFGGVAWRFPCIFPCVLDRSCCLLEPRQAVRRTGVARSAPWSWARSSARWATRPTWSSSRVDRWKGFRVDGDGLWWFYGEVMLHSVGFRMDLGLNQRVSQGFSQFISPCGSEACCWKWTRTRAASWASRSSRCSWATSERWPGPRASLVSHVFSHDFDDFGCFLRENRWCLSKNGRRLPPRCFRPARQELKRINKVFEEFAVEGPPEIRFDIGPIDCPKGV